MSYMRKIAFVITILGLSLLMAILLRKPVYVESLDGLVVGQSVEISGIVDEERKFGTGKLLVIDEVPVFCECSENYVGLDVVVYGIVERFPEDLRIKAFRVEVIN